MRGIVAYLVLLSLRIGIGLGENKNLRTGNDFVQLQGSQPSSRCGTKEPDERNYAAFLCAQAFAKFNTEQGQDAFETLTPITIPVCFHNP